MAMLSKISNFFSGIHTYLTISLAVLFLTATASLYVEHGKLVQEQLGRKNDRSSYELAQKTAEAKSLAEAREKEKKDSQNKETADARYADLYSKYAASLSEYKAAGSKTRVVYLPGPSDTSGSSDKPGEDSGVLISEEDADTCAVNTARLEAAHEWATSDSFK